MTRMIAAASRSGIRLFYFESTIPYTRRDGTETMLAVWRGHCRQCGEVFTIATPMPGEDGCMAGKAFERVHCDAHKRRAKK